MVGEVIEANIYGTQSVASLLIKREDTGDYYRIAAEPRTVETIIEALELGEEEGELLPIKVDFEAWQIMY